MTFSSVAVSRPKRSQSTNPQFNPANQSWLPTVIWINEINNLLTLALAFWRNTIIDESVTKSSWLKQPFLMQELLVASFINLKTSFKNQFWTFKIAKQKFFEINLKTGSSCYINRLFNNILLKHNWYVQISWEIILVVPLQKKVDKQCNIW